MSRLVKVTMRATRPEVGDEMRMPWGVLVLGKTYQLEESVADGLVRDFPEMFCVQVEEPAPAPQPAPVPLAFAHRSLSQPVRETIEHKPASAPRGRPKGKG